MILYHLSKIAEYLQANETTDWIFHLATTLFWFKLFTKCKFFSLLTFDKDNQRWQRGFFVLSFLFGPIIAAVTTLIAHMIKSFVVAKPRFEVQSDTIYQNSKVSPSIQTDRHPIEDLSLLELLRQTLIEPR